MIEPLISGNTNLFERVNMSALKRALDLQLPLLKSLGGLRASMMGMHVYTFALTNNSASIDRIVLQLQQKNIAWPQALITELQRCANLREQQQDVSEWADVYLNEARYLLLLAYNVSSDTQKPLEFLRTYQVYACSELLGLEQRPPFFTAEQIRVLIDPQSTEPVCCFAQQYCQRHRKPELLKRELAAQFAPLDDAQ